MVHLQIETIHQIADSEVIFRRGQFLQQHGAFAPVHEQSGDNVHVYKVDGNYGNYLLKIELNGTISTSCDCPYPGNGCKHVVAILLELFDRSQVSDAKLEPATALPTEHLGLSFAIIRTLRNY